MDFKEQYKHPKWQKLRLEVLEGNNFTCQHCGDTETTLNVHHPYYKKGAMIWDYSPYELMCLCEDCHVEEHELTSKMQYGISLLPRWGKQEILNNIKQLTREYCNGKNTNNQA